MDSFILIFLMLCIRVVPSTVAIKPALLLSPYIEQDLVQEARHLSRVDSSLFLNVTSHAGFITVDKRYNSNVFFWYFPVKEKPVNQTPWIVWLQGGPGATSLAGLFDEIGPFEYNNALKLRQWSWSTNHSVLFIDNPVGAGYSFTDSDAGFVRNMTTCSEHLYDVLQQILQLFPELQSAPLYIAGESYAGHYVPALGSKIFESGDKIGNISINLQGIIMGNPTLDREDIADYAKIFYQWGLIDNQGMIAIKPMQDAYVAAIEQNNSDKAFDLRTKLLDRLQEMAYQPQTYNVLKENIELHTFEHFIEQYNIREAIHVGNIKFTFSNNTVKVKLIADFLADIKPKVEELLEHYRVLIYCGQLDLTAPCVPSAEGRRRKWHWSYRDHFLNAPRKPWSFNNSLAGYVKSGGGLTEVLVRDAGHLAPIDKPAQIQQLISYFIRGLDLQSPINSIPDPADTPKYTEAPEAQPRIVIEGSTTLVILSVLLNVILVLAVIIGVVYFLRWKKRNESFFYTTADDSIFDGILTMT